MPLVDVSEVLSDPDLASKFHVIRRPYTAGANGVSTVTNKWIRNVVGVVTPAGANALSRLPEYQVQSKTISVITAFRLRGPSREGGATNPKNQQFMPDIVVWPAREGDRFVVSDLQDWSEFGAGFVNATCTSIDFVDRAPEDEVPQ